MKKKLYWILIAVFALIFLVSAIMVTDYLIEYFESERIHTDISNMHTTGPTDGSTAAPNVPTTLLPTTNIGNIPTTVPSTSQPSTSQPPTTTVPTPTTTVPVPPTTIPTPTEPEMLEEMVAIYELNNHVVGWIKIEGTPIDYPVLRHPTDKDYYLYRDFYGDDNKNGSIYIRTATDVDMPSDVVTIYGHNMASGGMFASVRSFKRSGFFSRTRYIQFDTLYERHTYEVVLCFRTSGTSGVGFPYHTYYNFENEAEFDQFVKNIRALALQDSGIDLNYGDKLILLSTCENSPVPNGRVVVVAKRIS